MKIREFMRQHMALEGLAGAHGRHPSMGSAGKGGYCAPPQAGRGDTAVQERPGALDIQRGLTEVATLVPGFDARRFSDEAMDIFFRVQGAWSNGDLDPVCSLLAPGVRQQLQWELDTLKGEEKINRRENIAVRHSQIQEAKVNGGSAFVAILFLATLLDYTVEERTGRLINGSKDTPVRFAEYWTFVHSAGGSSWRLMAIQQIR
jgi:predicted lipid-binding transport protein (Tim44 family)